MVILEDRKSCTEFNIMNVLMNVLQIICFVDIKYQIYY